MGNAIFSFHFTQITEIVYIHSTSPVQFKAIHRVLPAIHIFLYELHIAIAQNEYGTHSCVTSTHKCKWGNHSHTIWTVSLISIEPFLSHSQKTRRVNEPLKFFLFLWQHRNRQDTECCHCKMHLCSVYFDLWPFRIQGSEILKKKHSKRNYLGYPFFVQIYLN